MGEEAQRLANLGPEGAELLINALKSVSQAEKMSLEVGLKSMLENQQQNDGKASEGATGGGRGGGGDAAKPEAAPAAAPTDAAGEAPLPPGWRVKSSKSRPGVQYYVHDRSGKTQWERPTAKDVERPSRRQRTDDGAKVRVLHLLKKHAGSRRPASWRRAAITDTKEEAVSQLLALRATIAAAPEGPARREKFAELAGHESDCSSAKRGGDLGHFGRGKMQPPFEHASFSLAIDELSDVVDTDSGVHIILRLE